MSVIKAGQRVAGAGNQVVQFNLEDVASQAERYLAEVRKQAAGLIEQAQKEATRIRKQAAQEGREAAARTAAAEAEKLVEQRLTTLLPALREAAEELQQLRGQWLREWETGAVRLAAALAERIVRRELRHDSTIPLTWMREALELAAGSSQVVLHLNPQDRATLGAEAARLAKEIADLGGFEVVDDAEVPPGQCRLTTQLGQIDQRLAAQLARLEEELTS
mgnify:CR=1 FL=1